MRQGTVTGRQAHALPSETPASSREEGDGEGGLEGLGALPSVGQRRLYLCQEGVGHPLQPAASLPSFLARPLLQLPGAGRCLNRGEAGCGVCIGRGCPGGKAGG